MGPGAGADVVLGLRDFFRRCATPPVVSQEAIHGVGRSGAEFDRGSLGGRRAGLGSMMQHDDGRDFGLQFTTGKRATDMNGAQERRRRPLCPSRSGRGRDSISDGAARWAGMELGGVAAFGCEPVSWRGRAQECVEGSLLIARK